MIAAMPVSFARADLLANPAWVAQNLSNPRLRVLDCRWRVDGSGRRSHAAGHVPGSVYIDWATDLSEADDLGTRQLAPPAAFAAAMSHAGIRDDMRLVLLDDTQSLFAARAWWSLRAYGFAGPAILDGGWQAWLEAGLPISSAATDVQPTDFRPQPDPRRRVTSTELAALVAAREAQVVDARTPAEYLGQGGPGPRRGHIAGAIDLPAALLAESGGQSLPSAGELAQLISTRGLDREQRVVIYDTSGVGSAKVAFCLELMGFEQVAVYDAGWTDWAARPSDEFPIE
jgi:thiosulfate/3-mercaptopyruvate sulfurtransferase